MLVVDDQDDFRSILTMVLEAEDGLAALDLVRREHPHLVVRYFQRVAHLSRADVFLDKRDITTALLPVVRRLIPAEPDGCRSRSE